PRDEGTGGHFSLQGLGEVSGLPAERHRGGGGGKIEHEPYWWLLFLPLWHYCPAALRRPARRLQCASISLLPGPLATAILRGLRLPQGTARCEGKGGPAAPRRGAGQP